MPTQAQRDAQKRYDLNNKDKFRSVFLKLNKESDKDILDKLDSVDNKQGYIKELIRKDLQ